jgi:hypothetical protein
MRLPSRLRARGWKDPRQRVVFLHVPKCGGTSLASAIVDRIPGKTWHLHAQASAEAAGLWSPGAKASSATGDYEVLRFREMLLLYGLSDPNVQYADGHFPFSETAMKGYPEAAWMTLLREPVSRWQSHYFFDRYKANPHAALTIGLDEHIASDYGMSQGNDYVKFIGGARQDGDYRSQAAIARAKANLDRIALVGVLSDLEGLQRRFSERFGPPLHVPKLNKSPAPAGAREAMTPERKEQVRVLCAPDIAVYEHAQALAGRT